MHSVNFLEAINFFEKFDSTCISNSSFTITVSNYEKGCFLEHCQDQNIDFTIDPIIQDEFYEQVLIVSK